MKFRWVVLGAVVSYLLIMVQLLSNNYFGEQLAGWISLLVFGVGGVAFFAGLIYLSLIWPLREIGRKRQAGWGLLDCLFYHPFGLTFFFWFLAPFFWDIYAKYAGLKEVGENLIGWSLIMMFLACFLKWISWASHRRYRDNLEFWNEYFACMHNPGRRFGPPPEVWERRRNENTWTRQARVNRKVGG
jgi:hypothetical protein